MLQVDTEGAADGLGDKGALDWDRSDWDTEMDNLSEWQVPPPLYSLF